MRRFRMHRSKAYQRLGVLVDAGLVRHEQGVRCPRVYLATGAGLAAAKLELPRATVSAASCAHDLALVDVAIPIEQTPGLRVLTERELRRAVTGPGGQNHFRLRTLGGGESARGHWPDLVVHDTARETVTAIEVELTLKKADRIYDKLLAYSVSPYKQVRYLCANGKIAKAVSHQARRVGVGQQVKISQLSKVLAVGSSSAKTVVSQLETLLERERQAAAATRQRAEAAEMALESEQRAGFRLVDQIADYLVADRSSQREMRIRWEQMVARAGQRR